MPALLASLLHLLLLLLIIPLSTVHAAVHTPDPIPLSVREHWMRRAVSALVELRGTPCPFEAFGTVIVNHTKAAEGEEVCIGVNGISEWGNPTLHGEIAAINNCSAILTDPSGKYKLSPAEALKAYEGLSLYTTAEACPMCEAAISYARFAEYIYATSISTLIDLGWAQIDTSSRELFRGSGWLNHFTRIVGGVLEGETDGLFGWQFAEGEGGCPTGCGRSGEGGGEGGGCVVLGDGEGHDEL